MNTVKLNEIDDPDADISLNSYKLTNLANATLATDAVNLQTGDSRYYRSNVTLNNITAPSNNLSLNSHKITNLANATQGSDALNQTSGDARY